MHRADIKGYSQPLNALQNGCQAENYDGSLPTKVKRDAIREKVRNKKKSKKTKRSWLPWS